MVDEVYIRVTRHCEACGELMKGVYKCEIQRGRHVFCSVDCAKKFRRSKLVQWRTCQGCGMRYKGIHDGYCCEECKEMDSYK